jgi:NitT/TauT family transport system ATP-binding protein
MNLRDMDIEFDEVSKVFANGNGGVKALAEVSFGVQSHEFVAIVGPSGCGKSTVLRLVAGLIEPCEGEVRVGGISPAAARQRREIGMVFQDPTLLEWRTALGNVALPMELNGQKREARERALGLLDSMHLDGFADALPRELSGGMKSRVAIARALALSPRLLLMDESFGSLDELTRFRLNMELLRVRDQTELTILFVTHSVSEAAFLADRVVVMSPRPGRVVADIPIGLPRPRDEKTLDTDEYFEKTKQIRKHLGGVL